MPAGPRQLLEDRFQQLSSDLESLFTESREQARREFAEQLNQSVRRLRIAADADEICATLADSAARFTSGALLFRIEEDVARNPRIDVPLGDAPALASAADGRNESHDPLVSLAKAAQVSAPLVDLLGHDASTRAHIFPVAVRGAVPALLYCWGEVQGPAIELLAQVAAVVWTALPEAGALPEPEREPEPVAAPELITITPAPAAVSAPKPAMTWDDLPPAEQQVHLQAQRFARVQVAEMRLHHGDAVQSGRTRRNLYEALQQPIDTARETFQARFFTCPSMVDYLDLELTKILANEDPELLGHSYPGPLV